MVFKAFIGKVENLTGMENPTEEDWIQAWKSFRAENIFLKKIFTLNVNFLKMSFSRKMVLILISKKMKT